MSPVVFDIYKVLGNASFTAIANSQCGNLFGFYGSAYFASIGLNPCVFCGRFFGNRAIVPAMASGCNLLARFDNSSAVLADGVAGKAISGTSCGSGFLNLSIVLVVCCPKLFVCMIACVCVLRISYLDAIS